MKRMQIFYDYACPFCMRGYDTMVEVLKDFPDVEVEMVPCEAHPRPEKWGKYSDLLAAGMYVAKNLGADLEKYHHIMFKAANVDRVNIEDINVLKGLVADILDAEVFGKALAEGEYLNQVRENNQSCWGTYNFPAVPSFVMEGKKLPAIPGVGIDDVSLRGFLK